MTDREYHWRLLSESFDRALSIEEQECLERFIAEDEAPSEFVELFERLRDRIVHQDLTLEVDSSTNQYLGEQKKARIQQLLEAAMEKQHDSLSNRDVVLACELVNHGAITLRGLTEEISQWNSDSKSLSRFLKSRSNISDAKFTKIESYVSETIFSQKLDETLHDEVLTAIKQRIPEDDLTVFEDASDEFASLDFIKLLNKTHAGESRAFESLLDCLVNETRSVVLQTRMLSSTVRLKPIVDEVTLRLVGRKKLNQALLGCYYRNVSIATRELIKSDPELSRGLLRSSEIRQVAVAQVIDSLEQLADEVPAFVQMFNLRFFAGLTVQQVASLFELRDQDVLTECAYGTARLLQLIDE